MTCHNPRHCHKRDLTQTKPEGEFTKEPLNKNETHEGRPGGTTIGLKDYFIILTPTVTQEKIMIAAAHTTHNRIVGSRKYSFHYGLVDSWVRRNCKWLDLLHEISVLTDF